MILPGTGCVINGSISNGITFQLGADNKQTMTVSVKGVSTVNLSLVTISRRKN